MESGELILIAGALMATALAASLLAARLRVPGLLLFLGIGMAIGTDGTGWIDFNDYELARDIGIVALILILLEGGLAGGAAGIRSYLAPSLSLAVIGTIATALIAGLIATALFDLTTLEGMLLGSVLAATDAAAVFGVLRTSRLSRRLGSTLEGESGLNDPVAVLLVVGFIDWIQTPGYGLLDMAGGLASKLALGLAAGVLVGWLTVQAFRRMRLESTGLYPVASLTAAALAYGLAEVADGSGFLAVYLTGLALGSTQIPAKRVVVAFHEGMAWVAQLGMFLTLGLLVNPSELDEVALEGTLLALAMVFIARPPAVLVTTLPFGFEFRERLLLSWAGLRGAVPVILATFPVIADVPGSREFFAIVFFAVLISTLLQGTTIDPLTQRLGLAAPEGARPARRSITGRSPIFTVRPWRPEDGNPGYPKRIDECEVVEHLRTRHDAAGAVLALDDGRYAVSGKTLVIGSAEQVQRHARQRIGAVTRDAEREWWQEVVGVLAR